jgi:ATP-dependent DNA helicase RecG
VDCVIDTLTPAKPVQKFSFNAPVTVLKGVGPAVAARLSRLNIATIQDLLFHLPLRYQNRTRVTPIGGLQSGDEAVVKAEILITDVVFRGRRSLVSKISDGTGLLTLRFFNFSASQQKNLEAGKVIRCYGEVRLTRNGLEMVHPEYQFDNTDHSDPVASSLTPVYPATEGLRQFSLRAMTDQLVIDSKTLRVTVPEWLPETVRQELNLPSLAEAIAYVHRPPPTESVDKLKQGRHRYQQRLAFEELLAHHLSMRKIRQRYQQRSAPVFEARNILTSQLLAALPFALTAAQKRVVSQIENDLNSGVPMLRLLQGDVGSGKTIVATLAALQAVENSCQTAFMAPTELLAYQHYQNISQWTSQAEVNIGFFSSSIKGKARNETLDNIANGTYDIVVGTHALFQDQVRFNKLGLVIVDEQHRFGVHQRLLLRNKGTQNSGTLVNYEREILPHQLVMTATPIPRTLAMTAYADLDYSIIDELPPGRSPVNTVALENTRRPEVIRRVHEACKTGRQAYWVCTLIEESEVLQCQAAEDAAEQLAEALPDMRIGLVHGRMKQVQKERCMQAYKQGDIDLLVATTVIEVGVDVPNATLMVIENAERLGLAQLHQLRGRVGRSNLQSSCVLLYQTPLSQIAKARLRVMRETNDGFRIAQKDLEIRGPGEFLGTRQTGLEQFRIADLQRDQDLIRRVNNVSDLMLRDYPQQADSIIQRWLGVRESYGNV